MLTLATHNLPGTVDAATRRAIIGRLAADADIIALQEARWFEPAADTPDGWHAARGQDPALVVLHKTGRFARTGTLERRAYPDTDVGAWGAGPTIIKAGWDYGVRLRDRDAGRHLWVVDAHLIPSVEQARPADPVDAEGWDLRRRLYQSEIAQLVAMTSWVDVEPLFALGDFNATPGFELLEPMRAAFDGHATRPSHGDRPIDYIWHQRATVGRVWEMGTASDHDAILAEYTI